jgi:hypothetical protein
MTTPIELRADYETQTLVALGDDIQILARIDNGADPRVRKGALDIAIRLGATFGFAVKDVSSQTDLDGTIPEFNFSKAQLARHRVRAGLETPEQYEERRSLINSSLGEKGES